jgi:hypothetical protein
MRAKVTVKRQNAIKVLRGFQVATTREFFVVGFFCIERARLCSEKRVASRASLFSLR